MLVLSRRSNESIVIGGEIVVTVLEIRGDQVRLGIEAPRSVTVHRQEVHAEIQRENVSAAVTGAVDVTRLPKAPPPS
jgi:carbon storage regulator